MIEENISYIWLGSELILILLATFAVDFGMRRLFRYLRERKSANVYMKSLDSSLSRPLSILIWGYGIFTALSIIQLNYHCTPSTEARVLQARQLFLILALSWFLFAWKSRVQTILSEHIRKERPKNHAKQALFEGLSKLTTAVIFSAAGIMMLDVFGVPLEAIVAFGGISGLAVSWAGKDIIANFFGGLVIYANQPFLTGDWIYSPNKKFEGVVEEIGWYMTRIRTFERRPTFIPNALITDAIVENPGRMYNRRIKETIGIRYEDIKQVKVIVKGIEEMLRAHPEIDQKQFLMVHFLEFGPYSLNINVYTFTKTTDWIKSREIQQDVLLKIAGIIDSHGSEIAFPTQTLHVNPQAIPSPAR